MDRIIKQLTEQVHHNSFVLIDSSFSLYIRNSFFHSKNKVVDFRRKFNCDHLFNQCKTPAECNILQSSSASSTDAETNFVNFTCKYLISEQNQSTNNRIVVSQVNRLVENYLPFFRLNFNRDKKANEL